jgi:hypothetical protein
MTANRDSFVNVPNVLFILWRLVAAAYHACFAFQIIGWRSVGVFAAVSTFVLMMYSATEAAHEYSGNGFMMRHKEWFLTGFFATLFVILVIEYFLKGTPYQIEFLGLFLVGADLLVVGLIVFGPRRTVRPDS